MNEFGKFELSGLGNSKNEKPEEQKESREASSIEKEAQQKKLEMLREQGKLLDDMEGILDESMENVDNQE